MVENCIPIQQIKVTSNCMECNDRYVTLWQMTFPEMVTTISPIPTVLPLRGGVYVVPPPLETWQAVMTVLAKREQLK